MHNKQDKDLLIIARPDQSIQIYGDLLKQEDITFSFLTFKVVRPWVKRLFQNWKKLVTVERNASISWRCTLLNLLRYSFRFRWAQNWSEENVMENDVKSLLKSHHYKIIHYWPIYCYDIVERYAKEHPESIVMADVHFPNPEVTMKEMQSVYQQYGIEADMSNLERHLGIIQRTLKNAPAYMVPSQYVADTYKELFANKPCYVVSYGITVSPNYQKRYRTNISKFVFAGGSITIEKGCDLLCTFFSKRPDLELHLYGVTLASQEFIFAPFKKFSNIHFHGLVAKAELQQHICDYDVGIHLSRFDAYSLSVGEMVGCGLPVIVSEKTGIFFEVKQFGWGEVTSLNEDSVRRAIAWIREPEHYNRYVDRIAEYIKTQHKDYGQKMVDFYQSLVSA